MRKNFFSNKPVLVGYVLCLLSLYLPTQALPLTAAKDTVAPVCTLSDLEITFQTECYDNGTQPEWRDDYYLMNLKVAHPGAKVGDIVQLEHPHLIDQPQEFAIIDAEEAANGVSNLWETQMAAVINEKNAVPGWVYLGAFTVRVKDGQTGEVLCTKKFPLPRVKLVRPCSVCTVDGGAWNTNPIYNKCWPDEIPSEPCDDPLNFAPDPEYLSHTPIRYVKVVLHFFQVSDPKNPGQVHPAGPQHYSSKDVPFIRSWFSGPEGINEGRMAKICPPNADSSIHIPDSRIRFLLEYGEEGKDIFFHPNTQHWSISTHGCGKNPGKTLSLKGHYVTNPHPSLPETYRAWISQPNQQKAFHVFISRGHWVDSPGGDGQPDPDIELGKGADCFNAAAGGYTWPGESSCQDNPTQYIMGNYDQYLAILRGESNAHPSSLGHQITGEFFHVMTLDHTSPFQIHYQHKIGIDGCDDTSPSQYTNNILNCDYDHPGGRCHLTQCQMGRMHRYFHTVKPAFERFPTGYGPSNFPLFSFDERNCYITEPDIVIQDGQKVEWKSPKSLRSNVIVKTGGALYIRCGVGLPRGAKIIVEPGATYVLEGKVFGNCE